jgi:hypothetical protein
MRIRKIPAQQAAHFLMKLMFCMFAEDIDLLPGKVFERIMDTVTKASSRGLVDSNAGQRFAQLLTQLFRPCRKGGCSAPMKSCTSTADCSPMPK